MGNRCDFHDDEIKDIKDDFDSFKKDFSKRLDDLFMEVKKPIFTDKQIVSIIIGVIVYLILAVSYVNKTDARSLSNYEKISEMKEGNKEIKNLLIQIKEIVDKNEGRNEIIKNNK